jgi:hypothetical protein
MFMGVAPRQFRRQGRTGRAPSNRTMTRANRVMTGDIARHAPGSICPATVIVVAGIAQHCN